MTISSRYALAGLCNVAQQFSQLPELASFVGVDDSLRQILHVARQLSAGVPASKALQDKPSSPALPLKSIFCDLKADEVTGTNDLFWPALPLAMTEAALFPIAKNALGDATEKLNDLRGMFDKQAAPILEQLTGDPDNDSLIESLQLLMQRYLTPVPAADAEDTSLYDHARMTGALAAVLAGSDAGKLAQSNLAKDDTPMALLVGGDLSGIQDFIYTITSRGAASALRGRSFYLQLLTDAVMRYTLSELQLPATNVVYAGGGKFFLLARVSDAERLTDIQRHVSDVLLRHHGGDLYLSLQSVPLVARDFFDGHISQRWAALSEKHQAAKQRRFSELNEEQLAALFKPQGAGGDKEMECQVCGAEDDAIQRVDVSAENPEGVRKCPQCVSFEALGEICVSPKCWSIHRSKLRNRLLNTAKSVKCWPSSGCKQRSKNQMRKPAIHRASTTR